MVKIKAHGQFLLFRIGISDKFGGSAWEYVPSLKKWYLHLFDVSQADLNWENPQSWAGHGCTKIPHSTLYSFPSQSAIFQTAPLVSVNLPFPTPTCSRSYNPPLNGEN